MANKAVLPLEVFCYLLLLVFFVTLIPVGQRNFYFLVPFILLILGCYAYFSRLSPPLPQEAEKKIFWVVVTFSFYSLIALLMGLIHHDKLASYKFSLLPLLLLPILYLFIGQLKKPKVLPYIFAISSFPLASLALYEHYFLHLQRAFALEQPVIPAAGIATTYGLFSFAFLLGEGYKKPALGFLLGVATFLSLLASFLTGSRGAWWSAPLVMIFLLIYWRHHIHRRAYYLLFIIIALFILLILYGHTDIMIRFSQIKTDLIWFIRDHNANSSIGLRFEFWKSALLGSLQKPWLGWGDSGYIPMKIAQVKEGLIIPEAVPFVHPHNQFLDALVKGGRLALGATLLLFIVPLWIFVRALKKEPVLAILGCILIFCVVTFSLSDSFLRLPLGMVFYLMTTLTLLGFIFHGESAS